MSKITNDGLTRSGTGGMPYSCTHMATVGVKGLKQCQQIDNQYQSVLRGKRKQLRRKVY